MATLRDRIAAFARRNWRFFDGSWRYNTHDVLTLWESLKTYLHNEFMLIHRHDAPVPLTIQVPLRGARSLVFFVQIDDVRRVVRMYPLSERISAEVQRTALELLASHKVRAPRLVHYLDDLPKYRAIFLAEEFVQGVPRRRTELSESDMQSIARELARLHSVHNPQWGAISSPQRGALFPYLVTRTRRQFQTIARARLVDGTSWDDVQRWMNTSRATVETLPHFSLVHGDLHVHNGLFTADGEYCLIDLSKLNWNVAAKDVARLRDTICAYDEGLFDAFEREYVSYLAAENRSLYEQTCPLFMGLHELGVAASELKRTRRRGHTLRTVEPADAAAQAWQRFKQIAGMQS